MRSLNEVWFDPEAGFRQTETFDGVVQFDTVLGPDEMPEHATSIYSSLGAGYREALESGQAEVVGEDTVDGTAVYWIRIEDGHDVAVSRDTFEPTYIRVTQNGTPALTRIVTYETVEPGSAPLDAQGTPPGLQDVTDRVRRRDRPGRRCIPARHGSPSGPGRACTASRSTPCAR